MCPPDETIEDPQPTPAPQPAPTFDLPPAPAEESKFPIVPVAAGVGAIVLLAALAG